MGRVLRRDDRDRRAPTACIAATRCRSGSRPAPRTGRRRASGCCRIEASYCGDNAGWACNELGRHYVEGRLVAADPDRALAYFSRACEARFQAGCVNLLDRVDAEPRQSAALDLRLLLREGGPNLLDMPEPELYARACRHGWTLRVRQDVGVAMTRTTLARGVALASLRWLALVRGR